MLVINVFLNKPFGVLKYKCCAGIMVTASHNPKEDNGYKVYFDNGAQVCLRNFYVQLIVLIAPLTMTRLDYFSS